MAPRYIRRDPDGLDVFAAEDGREVRVASDASPFAQGLIGMSRTLTADTGPQSSLDAPTTFGEDLPLPGAEWMVQPQEPEAPPPARPLVYAPPSDTIAQPDLSGVPAEWLAPAHEGMPQQAPPPPAPPSFRGQAAAMMAADPSRAAAVPVAPAAAPQQAGAIDLTGGGMRPGVDRGAPRRGGMRAPQADPLDALMTGPGGYQDPIAGLAGSPRDRSLDRAEGFIDQAGDLAAQRAQLQGQAHEMAQEAADEGERRRVELENDRRAAMGMAHDRYRRAVERVQSMQMDPARFFREGGNVIGAAIGIALGAAGSAVSGDQSHMENAMNLIQQTIDRDIDAQRANIANAQAGLAGEENLLQILSQEFDSREAAEQAARAAMLESVAHRIGRMEADLGTSDARLAAEQARFDLQQQAQAAAQAAVVAEEDREMERALQMAQLRRRLAQAQREERRAMGGGGAGGALRTVTPQIADTFNRMVGSGYSPEQAAAELRIAAPPSGRFAEASSDATAGGVAALSTQLDELERLLPAAGEDIPGVGRFDANVPDIFTSEAGQAIRQQVDNVIDLLGRLRSGAAISEDEFSRFRRILGVAGQSEDALRRGISQVRSEIQARTVRRTEGRTRDQRVDEAAGRAGLSEVSE